MRKAPLRLSCPACLGLALEVTSVTSGAKVHHCPRCGGTWLIRGQIARVRTASARALRAMIRRAADAAFLCHDCHAPMHRDAASCSGCGWANRLECPGCGKPMRRKSEGGVTVDACGGCQGVWLDHHELSAALWTVAAATAAVQARGETGSAADAAGGASSLLDGLWFMPDMIPETARGVVNTAGMGMETVGHGAGSAVELASHTAGAGLHGAANVPGIAGSLAEGASGLGDALSGMAEAAGGMAEVAGEAAGGVFSLIGAIFEGLGSLS